MPWPLISIATTASAASPKDTMVVLVEAGPQQPGHNGVGSNRPAYATSWNLYDRLLRYGTKTHPDDTVTYDYNTPKPELAESWTV